MLSYDLHVTGGAVLELILAPLLILACTQDNAAVRSVIDAPLWAEYAETNVEMIWLPEGESRPAEESWNDAGGEGWCWTWAEPRVRIVRRPIDGVVRPKGTDNRFDYLWTGDAWYAANAAERSYIISPEPRLHLGFDCMPLFNGMYGWPTLGAPAGLRDVVTNSKILESEVNGSLTSIRVSRNRSDTVQMVVTVDRSRNALSEVLLDVFKPTGEGSGRSLHTRVRYAVLDWTKVNDRFLPQRAIREAHVFAGELAGATPEKPVVQRIGYLRRSIVILNEEDVPPNTFARPPVHAGDGVVDKRLRLAYTIGKRELLIDGQPRVLEGAINDILEADDLTGVLQSAMDPLGTGGGP